MAKPRYLLVGDFIKLVYGLMIAEAEVYVLNEQIDLEIGDEPDAHHHKNGYLSYDSLGVIALNGRVWALGRGFATGSYTTMGNDSDIAAFSLPQNFFELTEEEKIKSLKEGLSGRTYFMNSMVVGYYNGRVIIKTGSIFHNPCFPLKDTLNIREVEKDGTKKIVYSRGQAGPFAAELLAVLKNFS